jgi:predicted transcriptional regulator
VNRQAYDGLAPAALAALLLLGSILSSATIVGAAPGSVGDQSRASGLEVSIEPESQEVDMGDSKEFKARAKLNGTEVPAAFSWSVSNLSRARLDSWTGAEVHATGVDRGRVVVRVNASHQGLWAESTAVLLVRGLQELYLEVSPAAVSLSIGEQVTLVANCTDRYRWWVEASYSWEALGDVVEVESAGEHAIVKATAGGYGVVRITGDYEGRQETVNVSVSVQGGPGQVPGPQGFGPELVALVTGLGVGAGALLVLLGTEIGILAGAALVMPLFTRIKRERTLDHFVRGQIFQYVKMNPGASYSTIKRQLGLRNGTLTYHLKMLQLQGFLRAEREGLHCFFFPADMPKPAARTVWLSATQARLAGLLAASPGVTQAELVKISGLKQQVVSYNMLALERAGVVSVKREGRVARYRYVEVAAANGLTGEEPATTEPSPTNAEQSAP